MQGNIVSLILQEATLVDSILSSLFLKFCFELSHDMKINIWSLRLSHLRGDL